MERRNTPLFDPDVIRDATGRVLEGPHKHLQVLERRMSYLRKRIERGTQEGKTLTYDVLEMEALKWAVDTIYEFVDLPEDK